MKTDRETTGILILLAGVIIVSVWSLSTLIEEIFRIAH
jgi:hypothetical protein